MANTRYISSDFNPEVNRTLPPFAGSELSLITEINLQTFFFESQEGFLGENAGWGTAKQPNKRKRRLTLTFQSPISSG
jgi:hypothetical protein